MIECRSVALAWLPHHGGQDHESMAIAMMINMTRVIPAMAATRFVSGPCVSGGIPGGKHD
jgi:hypothetical protein